ncbi:hypothetical protein ACFVFQ_35370 [Streptomyces sp. NPDC057743]|uniref:COG4315 family predicted lipoprotein n=1 Tax=Streptomyces sp. NPDC057743 TaxID=3346236 RepID=UPI003695EB44
MRNPVSAAGPAGVAAVAALVAAVLGGCANQGGGTAPSRTQTPSATGPVTASAAPSTPPPGPVAVHARSGPLGTLLVDGQGRTLYLFEADGERESTCYGGCAERWPPVLVSGAPTAGAGVKKELLGTLTRRDGGREVTYDGHPLYYFVRDKRPGDAKGQGADDHGGKWYVLAPSGDRITKPAPGASPSGSH